MKIYISGKITGDPDYKQKFKGAEVFLKNFGFEVKNPADIETTGKPWIWYIKQDIVALMDCDAIFLLKDWKRSKGAKLEHYIAKKMGMRIYRARDIVNLVRS